MVEVIRAKKRPFEPWKRRWWATPLSEEESSWLQGFGQRLMESGALGFGGLPAGGSREIRLIPSLRAGAARLLAKEAWRKKPREVMGIWRLGKGFLKGTLRASPEETRIGPGVRGPAEKFRARAVGKGGTMVDFHYHPQREWRGIPLRERGYGPTEGDIRAWVHDFWEGRNPSGRFAVVDDYYIWYFRFPAQMKKEWVGGWLDKSLLYNVGQSRKWAFEEIFERLKRIRGKAPAMADVEAQAWQKVAKEYGFEFMRIRHNLPRVWD